MSSRYQEYSRPPVNAQEPPIEYTKTDRRVKRYTDCNECRAKDPNYTGCNHPEDADDFHPDGGPALGRIDHQKPKDPDTEASAARKLIGISLADIFSGACYPSYRSWLINWGHYDLEIIPESLRVCLTQVDEKTVRDTLIPEREKKIMLRYRALQETLRVNIGEIPKSIIIFTTFGHFIGAATDKDLHYGNCDPKDIACVLAFTFRSATATLQSNYNLLCPTSSEVSKSTDDQAETKTPKYTNWDQVLKKKDRNMLKQLPLPILHQESYVANAETGTKKIKSLLVTTETMIVAVEYLLEGLHVGVMGFGLKDFIKEFRTTILTNDENTGAGEGSQAAAEKKAKTEEMERRLGNLEDWTGAFADHLRQELKDFKLEFSREQ